MGTKTIQGDLNVTGSVTANGTNLSNAVAEGAKVYNADFIFQDNITLTETQVNKLRAADIVIDNDGLIFNHVAFKDDASIFIGIADDLTIYLYTFSVTGSTYKLSEMSLDDLLDANGIAKASDVGTKLYKHVVAINGEEFIVICPEASSFAEAPNTVKEYYIGYITSDPQIGYLSYYNGTYTLHQVDSSAFASDSSITDTVTPL